MSDYDVGLVLFDDGEDGLDHWYYGVDTSVDDSDWTAFVTTCLELQKHATLAHVSLVRAVLNYVKAPASSLPEREAQGDRVRAFMPLDFDIGCLGAWTELKGVADFNAQTFGKVHVFKREINRWDPDPDL